RGARVRCRGPAHRARVDGRRRAARVRRTRGHWPALSRPRLRRAAPAHDRRGGVMRAGRWLAGAALVVLLAVAATAWPLATWAVSLALFGVPHVLVELRWVDERFARRFGGGTTLAIATGLALIVLVRVLGTAAP